MLNLTTSHDVEALMEQLKDEFTIVIVTHNAQQAARVTNAPHFSISMAGTAGSHCEMDLTEKMTESTRKATSDYRKVWLMGSAARFPG